MAVWQCAAGDGNRDYADVFLKYGVFLVGPGSDGPYFGNEGAYNDPDSASCRPFIKPFAEHLAIGDRLILKRPSSQQWEILAVGEVVSDYLHSQVFADVEGWDLQHCRSVRWKTPRSQEIVGGLTRGTLKGVNIPSVIAAADQVWTSGQDAATTPLPIERKRISVDEVVDALMSEGIPVQRAQLMTDTIWRLRRVAQWYQTHGADVGEHEIRTFLIVPLLTSLGWAEQKVKIEWNRMDVVLFDTAYKRGVSNPLVIIESKRLFDGMRHAADQASVYAKAYPSCQRFIVSDGIRYKLFVRDGQGWRFSAYMNLLYPMQSHPYEENVEGAVAFFRAMIPGLEV